MVKSPVLVKVNEPKFSILEFKVNVVLTSKFDPKVTFEVPFRVNTLTALLAPGVVWFINNVLVLDP